MIGTTLAHYEITAHLGTGGMGEVYQATDSKLGRSVAIKLLPEGFTHDADRAARFEREARVLASLNHPRIAGIYGVEESGGRKFLVMELVPGETLAERIARGPIPLDESMAIASQIAEGLGAAHEKGVIHRDLKPANIKVTADGEVKVLDFGLAKAFAGEAGIVDSTNSPTMVSLAATHIGIILGTAAYMAPEQAKGKAVDKRADIWAFGVVLHEMLTGERLFQHDDVTETLAAVVMKVPELDRAPVKVRRLLKKCLEKDPKKRLRDIGDVWELLDEPALPPAAATEVAIRPHRAVWIPWSVAALMLLALVAGTAWHFRPSPPLTITKFPLTLAEGQAFTTSSRSFLAISPNGTQMAYVANQRLYLRNMSELEAKAIPGTDLGSGILNPVFSPDGKSLAFYADAEKSFKKVAVSGGAPVTVAPANNPTGASWGPSGIVWAQPTKGILRVSANGGEPETLVNSKANEQIEGPQLLPGGQAILFTQAVGANTSNADWEKAQIVVQTLKSGERRTLITGGSDARYLPTGHLIYALRGVLFAVPFDLQRLQTNGGPVSMVEGVMRSSTGAAQFAISASGTLIYVPGPVTSGSLGQTVLGRIDRKGDIDPLKVPPAAYDYPRVSKNGKYVAYQIDDGKDSSIWVYELSGTSFPRRLTLPNSGSNRYPIWSSDSERVAFQSDREGDFGIYWQRADGSGTAERLTKPDKGVSHIPDSWSPDGQRFSFTAVKDNTSIVWTYSLADKKATLFAEAPGLYVSWSVFSPDGHWIAYHVNDKGTSNNFIQTFPPTATRYQLPPDRNDNHPLWSTTGKELFYSPGLGMFGSVTVNMLPSPNFGTPVRMPRVGFITHGTAQPRPFDILPDGQHFIGVVSIQQSGSGPVGATAPQIQVVLNWFEELKQRMANR